MKIPRQKLFSFGGILDSIKSSATKIGDYLSGSISNAIKNFRGSHNNLISESHNIDLPIPHKGFLGSLFGGSSSSDIDPFSIPGYKELIEINNDHYRYFGTFVQNLWKYIPCFCRLVPPEKLKEFARDYNNKWSEVLFMYTDKRELIFYYDFSGNYWGFMAIIDGQKKDYMLSSGVDVKSVMNSLAMFFNIEKDDYLKALNEYFIKKDKEDKSNYSEIFNKYLNWTYKRLLSY